MSDKEAVNTEQWNANFAILMESGVAAAYRKLMLNGSRITELLSDKNNRIVDIGCGFGASLAYLWSRGYRNLAAIEPDVRLTKTITAHMKVDLRHCMAEKIDFPDESFDAVLIYGILHHLIGLDAYWAACDEVTRILKPGGYIFIIEPGRYWALVILEPIFRFLGLFSKTFRAYSQHMDEERPEHHFFLKNHPKVREYLLAKGFNTIVDDYRIYTWLFTIQKPANNA